MAIYSCITASGSWKHQLLAAMKKRRNSPNLPLEMRARPDYFGCSQDGGAHPFYGGAPPLFWVLTKNQQAPIHFPILSPPPAFNIS